MRLAQCAQEEFARLTPTELAQLGTRKVLRNGVASEMSYVPRERWKEVRDFLLARSRTAAAKYLPDQTLETRMTAYTPGETLALLAEPEVVKWHQTMANFKLPETLPDGRVIERIVFVPCAKTKPWATATKGLYGAYNEIRALRDARKIEACYFVTISEPLGVVPESHWGDFPQYDNPGLFHNEMLRSGGLLTSDWIKKFGERYVIPFDEAAYGEAIGTLAGVIARFMNNVHQERPDVRWISFVENMSSDLSTHGDMLNRAHSMAPWLEPGDRYQKKERTRIAPREHLERVLRNTRVAPGGKKPLGR